MPPPPHASARAALPRRRLLQAGAGTLLALHWRTLPAQEPAAPSLQAAVDAWAGGRPLADSGPDGPLQLDIPPLVENGHAVPVVLRMASPMTEADHVRELLLLNERNPLDREVLRAMLTPACGRAELACRIRLATSQQVVALARHRDGRQWQRRVEVLVTLAACIEG